MSQRTKSCDMVSYLQQKISHHYCSAYGAEASNLLVLLPVFDIGSIVIKVVCIMGVQQERVQISWRLKTGLSLARLTVLQGFYTFKTTIHHWLSHSSHQEYSMVILWATKYHLTRPLHSGNGYLTCLVGLDMDFKKPIFLYTHWR